AQGGGGGVVQEREEIACVCFFLRTCDQPKRSLWLGLRRGGEGNGDGRRRGLAQDRRRRKLPRRCLHHNELEALDVFEQIVAIKNAFAFLRAQVAAREQAAEPSPRVAVARIGEDVRRAVGEDESRPGVIGE